jgi:hypothetical protein
VRRLPVQHLARVREVVDEATHGASPELVPPRLRPPTRTVRGAQPETPAIAAAPLLHQRGTEDVLRA